MTVHLSRRRHATAGSPPTQEDPMLDVGMPRADTALDIDRYMSAAQARWERLTASDYAQIKSVNKLAAAVEERYSMPMDLARQDVEQWLWDVGFRRRSTPI
jgi:hypothetical protein